MSNFVFTKEKFVLIHIPKCGGLSIREYSFKNSNKLGPFFGEIPKEYMNFTKVAIVRNPYTRFASLCNMFMNGTDVFGSSFKGSKQDLLNILHDARINGCIKKGTMSRDERIKHHGLPQTHEYNSLHLANYVCSFEKYSHDVSNVFKNILNVKDFQLKKQNVSKKPNPVVLDQNILDQVNEYYKDDFIKLNYKVFTRKITIDKGQVHEY